jgi:hypothetical protein
MEPAGLDDVIQALAALKDTLTRSAAVVKGGQLVDLVGLDREVQQTLVAVTTLPAVEARSLLPVLDDMLGLLDTIAADLQQVHGAAAPETDNAAARRIATAAYRRTGDEL